MKKCDINSSNKNFRYFLWTFIGVLFLVGASVYGAITITDTSIDMDNQPINNASNTAPIGSIMAWAGNLTGTPSLPSGWVIMAGQTLNDAESPFNGQVIPDLNGNNYFLRGNSTSGATGGESTVTLSEAEMPSHSHDIDTTENGNKMNLRASAGGGDGIARGSPTNELPFSLVTDARGSDSAHENKPPYYDIIWIMRIK